jgi:predicted AAA+ superfamily ATPase
MRRKIFESLHYHLKKDEATLLIGARQTGKSTLLKQLESACKSENIPTVFINLENKNLLAELDSNPLNLLAYWRIRQILRGKPSFSWMKCP